MEPVDQKFAEKCFREFKKQFFPDVKRASAKPVNTSGRTAYKGKITTGVSFDSKDFAKWARKVSAHAKRIEIRFGVHPARSGKSAMQEEEGDRLTVFLCPVDEEGNPAEDENGEPIPPVNSGMPHP